MKKMMTLALALVLVFGLSAVTMAGNDLDNGKDVTVNVKVDKYAELDLDSTSVDLGNIDPNNNVATTNVGYAVKANTSVEVTSSVKTDLSDKSELNLTTDEADTFNYSEGGINTNDQVGITATLAQDDDEAGDGAWEKVQAGDYSGTVTLTVSAQ